ncbi:MAG: hypothetical protein NZ570_05235 [Candidatus Caldarchaeum sp.]|nr:hypothetical protein [Candidatus Caldarchaeum sp.]MDW7978243.1 hypothetical protein [Candidatus Caldarchaeum sp.]MDW8360217.1 hypothetical protein [Candidatus Caldarchaeum sp.]
MVEIVYNPVKEIVVLEYIKYPTADELIRNMILPPGQPAVLYWADGVVFLPIPLVANNTKVIEEIMNGRLYWMSVSFAPLPNYSQMLSAEKGPEALVINVSRSQTLSTVARWLKQRLAEP